jgi:hypothetical protein
MQRCPTCDRAHPDDAPPFCPDDGARPVSGDSGYSPQPPASAPAYGSAPPPRQNAPQATLRREACGQRHEFRRGVATSQARKS